MEQRRRVLTGELIPGMIIADDVYAISGQLVVGEGNIVTEKLIVRLGFYSVPSVVIKVEDEKDLEEASLTKGETTYLQRIKESRVFKEFSAKYSSTTTVFGELLRDVAKNGVKEEVILKMTGYAMDLFSSIENNLEIFDMLHNMRDNDDSTYAHSLNVALISSAMAKWIGFDAKEREALTMSALFHDIGKTMIPSSILNKMQRLDVQEYTIIKTHTLQGYNILKNMNIDERVALTALMHHERCDGSGYPIGLEAGQINSFSKIVSIADVYDAMTSSRVYREAISPFKVISIFEQEGFSLYDTDYLVTFLRNIVNTYLQNTVLLSNGQKGTVILINNLALSRPVVQLNRGGYIDLYKQPEITIEAII